MVRCLGRISKVNSTPLDIENPIGRGPRHGRVNTACATRESRAAALRIGALVVPIREHGVVVAGPRQAHIGEGRVGGCELSIAIGRHCDAVEGLVVQRIGEWQ